MYICTWGFDDPAIGVLFSFVPFFGIQVRRSATGQKWSRTGITGVYNRCSSSTSREEYVVVLMHLKAVDGRRQTADGRTPGTVAIPREPKVKGRAGQGNY